MGAEGWLTKCGFDTSKDNGKALSRSRRLGKLGSKAWRVLEDASAPQPSFGVIFILHQ